MSEADSTTQQNILLNQEADNNPEPFITDRKQLSDPKVFENFREIVDKIIEFDDGQQALFTCYLLEEMLLGQYPQLKTESPELFGKYQALIVLLKFIALSTRPFPEIQSLIKEHLLEAIQAKIKIHEKLQDVLEFYDDVREDGKIAESLASAMVISIRLIGKDQFTLNERNTSPTIGNWLLDYNQNTRKAPGILDRRGAVERISYINRSTNARKLSKDEQRLLLIVLEIYDWLKYGTSFNEQVMDDSKTFKREEIPSVVFPPASEPAIPSTPPHGTDLEVLRRQIKSPTPLVSPPMGEMSRTRDREGELQNKVNFVPQARVAPPAIFMPIRKAEIASSPLKVTPKSEAPRKDESRMAPAVKMTPEEIKREVSEPELIAHKEEIASSPPRIIPRVEAPRKDMTRPTNAIGTVDDLKKIDLAYLRQGQLQNQISNIKYQILNLAQVNRLLPYYTVNAFEQSPLFRAYMMHGRSKLGSGEAVGDLTQEEFEALTDLRKELERL